MPTGAQTIARRLYDFGCRHAFGMPGGEVLAIIDALDEAGIAFHLVKHENAAGFMAEGQWHATGAPGILVATVGPGIANCVNAIANAHQDRVPMIVIAGRVDQAEAETYTHQVFDHEAMLKPITKATFSPQKGSCDVVAAKALSIATTGQPGPVFLDLPITVAETDEPARPIAPVLQLPIMGPANSPTLDDARDLLKRAKRPVMIAGVDAVNQDAAKAIEAFCRRFSAPLVTSYKGKGIIEETDSLALGGAGLSPKADTVLLPLIRQSDCIILAGYDPIEMRIGWRNPWPDPGKVIEFSAVAPMHFMHHAGTVFTGDIAAGLAALSEGQAGKNGWPDDAPATAKAKLQSLFAPEADWGPGTVFEMIRAMAPPETVITADSGAHRILLSQQWHCFSPRGMLQSSALCTMGCALPIAIGHKIGKPDVPVIAFMGDAGAEMVIGELATIRDMNMPLVVVILQDEALALIDLKQRSSGRKQVGVTFGATDFAAVARAYGGHGVTVGNKSELESEIRSALHRQETFSLIAARISNRAYEGRF
jgi:acetolactate synthase I/II/III large subunit